jgi:geranylgeranyl diphosphate synthase, type II
MNILPREEFTKQFTDFLDSYLAVQVKKAGQLDVEYQKLWENISILAKRGGKRTRPYITYLSYAAYGGDDLAAIMPLAASTELMHLYLLVIDDVMDRDFVRWGGSNIEGVYKDALVSEFGESMHATQAATSSAILAGCIIGSATNDLVLQSKLEDSLKLKILQTKHETMFLEAGGQLLDSLSTLQDPMHIDHVKICINKTSAYSFCAPLCIGALAAGADQTQIDLLNKLGYDAGIAFQLADDLLGVFGNEDKLGKKADDIEEGKHTLLVQKTLELVSEHDKQVLMHALGNSFLSIAETESVKDLIKNCGSVDIVQNLAKDYLKSARLSLAELNISAEAKAGFEGFIETLVNRDR